MSFTLRSRFFLGAFLVCALGVVVAALTGAGWFSLAGLPVALFYGYGCRRSLRIDDRGVCYRDLWPPADFELTWSEITEVALDVVYTGSPGQPGVSVVRARFLQRDAAPRAARLFSVHDGAPLLEACRARGVPVVDERERAE